MIGKTSHAHQANDKRRRRRHQTGTVLVGKRGTIMVYDDPRAAEEIIQGLNSMASGSAMASTTVGSTGGVVLMGDRIVGHTESTEFTIPAKYMDLLRQADIPAPMLFEAQVAVRELSHDEYQCEVCGRINRCQFAADAMFDTPKGIVCDDCFDRSMDDASE